RHRREHALRACTARIGPKFHAHRHARRTNRDGRFFKHPYSPMAAPSAHTFARDRAGGDRYRDFGRKRHEQIARAQPGDFEHATFVRGFPARHFHQRQNQDGRLCKLHADQNPRVGRSDRDRRFKRVAALANCPRVAWNLASRKMYKTILIPVENRETDQTILAHIRPLARLTNAELILMHVADGWVARNYEEFNLRESDEMREDRAYLSTLENELRGDGF